MDITIPLRLSRLCMSHAEQMAFQGGKKENQRAY